MNLFLYPHQAQQFPGEKMQSTVQDLLQALVNERSINPSYVNITLLTKVHAMTLQCIINTCHRQVM